MRARGIDISHYQESFTFKNNIDFIVIKATEGIGKDDKFEELLASAKDVSIKGAYHYFRTEVSPILQAENLLACVNNKCLHFLVVDYEAKNNVLDMAGAASLLDMLEYLVANQAVPIILYTSPYIYRDNLRVWYEEFDAFPLWLARWSGDSETGDPTQGILERDWQFWQYSADGNLMGEEYGVESRDVDLDVFNGTFEDLKAWLGIEEPAVDILATITHMLGTITANVKEIEGLWAEDSDTKIRLDKMFDSVASLQSLCNTNSLGIAELAKRLATLEEGQLELAENGLGYEDKFKTLNTRMDDFAGEVILANGKLHSRIDGLAGGHNHPRWMARIGLVK